MEQGESGSQETDQLVGLSSAFSQEKDEEMRRDISHASTCPKILLHFKILEICFKCKFHSTYISICMQIFKMYVYVKPICLRSIWKILAENADKVLIR